MAVGTCRCALGRIVACSLLTCLLNYCSLKYCTTANIFNCIRRELSESAAAGCCCVPLAPTCSLARHLCMLARSS